MFYIFKILQILIKFFSTLQRIAMKVLVLGNLEVLCSLTIHHILFLKFIFQHIKIGSQDPLWRSLGTLTHLILSQHDRKIHHFSLPRKETSVKIMGKMCSLKQSNIICTVSCLMYYIVIISLKLPR